MALNLERMLERCQGGQWDIDAFDWHAKPAPLSRFDEVEACNQFTNLIYVERIAALAFLEFSKKADSPLEREIFKTFYDDEVRHAEAMFRLSNYFNQNNYKIYTPDRNLVRFVRSMSTMIKDISPEFASAMVTAGELVLDVALLRSVNDYIDDPLSRAVIEKVNQDESRHIAMDFYLCEKYGDVETEPMGVRGFLKTMSDPTLISGMAWATVALSDLFGRVQAIMDPEGKRFREAQRRFAQLGEKNPAIAANRNYAAVLKINTATQTITDEITRIMKLLRVGLYKKIDRAEAAGEKKHYDETNLPQHDVIQSAVDMMEQDD
ncbi:MAG: ferritin-like domain-containing protein [Chrysiogenetes bacterium]|nr:ferritin-like domain-containing protein [Chrysiogenetes bacterium]